MHHRSSTTDAVGKLRRRGNDHEHVNSSKVHIDRVEINVHVEGKPLYMTPQRASEEVGLAVSYLKQMIREKRLPSYKGEGTGGHIHIRTEDLIAFMELRRVYP